MDTTLQRPDYIDTLITDYGRIIDIPSLAFDEENLIGLNFDGIELSLYFKADSGTLLIKALLDVPEAVMTAKMLGKIAALNIYTFSDALGFVGLDPDVGAWIWIDRIDTRALTAGELGDRLNAATRHIAFWNERIADLVRTASDRTADAPIGESFIRA